MSKEKLTSSEIIDLISAQAKIGKKTADDFLKILFETIEEELIAGNQVKIKGFGTFKLQWNEPRKSVNVQTGEEIILAGYNKVTFIPDTSLKDLVNEPFAHLEPIALDDPDIKSASEADPIVESVDPLRIFNEQATEIKDILSEIQAMSLTETTKNKTIEAENKKNQTQKKIEKEEYDPEIVEPEFDLVEQDEEPDEEKVNEIVPTQEESVLTSTIESVNNNTDTNKNLYQNEISEDPTQVNEITVGKVKPRTKKKKSKIGWIILLVILLGLSGSAAYMYFYPPAFCWCKYKIFTTENIDKVKEKGEHIKDWMIVQKEKIFGKETPKVNAVAQPDKYTHSDAFSEPDSINTPESVDTLALIFSQRKSYGEYLGSERIQSGSRLTYISKRYYGNKEFWVYIYEANKEKIGDPDNIRPGTLIKIPKMDKKLIDDKNPRCLEYARQLHDLYINNSNQ
jgi:nucleoid DNA-binding protein/nucleoid-associated protein YgaU